MSVSPAVQGQQIRDHYWGVELVSAVQIPPTGSSTLWTVRNGSVYVTAVSVVVVNAMSATATTLNIGCNVTNSPSAAALMTAGVLTSLAAGSRVAGVPVITGNPPAIAGHVLATAGPVTWIATATQTGTVFVTLSYIPANAGATVGP